MLSSLYTEAEKKQVHWFVMRAYKNEKLAEEKLSSKNGLEHFIPKHYAVRTYHGKKTRQLVRVYCHSFDMQFYRCERSHIYLSSG